MKNIARNLKNKLMFAIMVVAVNCNYAFAADANSMWDNGTSFIFSWIVKIGFLLGAFGLIQVGVSYASDNPDARVRGIQFFAAGCIVFAVGMSPHFVSV